MNKIKNHITRVVAFRSYADANYIKVETDADLYGGDTIANVSYNIKEDSCKFHFKDKLVIVEGNFEMKNKKMIDYDNMFARLSFSVLIFSLLICHLIRSFQRKFFPM